MPKVVELKSASYKDELPDKFMKLELTPEEMEKFYEAFPGFKETITPISDDWNPAKIKVEITVEAFKKKFELHGEEKK